MDLQTRKRIGHLLEDYKESKEAQEAYLNAMPPRDSKLGRTLDTLVLAAGGVAANPIFGITEYVSPTYLIAAATGYVVVRTPAWMNGFVRWWKKSQRHELQGLKHGLFREMDIIYVQQKQNSSSPTEGQEFYDECREVAQEIDCDIYNMAA